MQDNSNFMFVEPSFTEADQYKSLIVLITVSQSRMSDMSFPRIATVDIAEYSAKFVVTWLLTVICRLIMCCYNAFCINKAKENNGYFSLNK